MKDTKELDPTEMFHELIKLNYVKPADKGSRPIIPSAYEYVPNVTTNNTKPIDKGDAN